MPKHVCAQTRLCLVTIVHRHVCAHTRLSPDTFMPRHVCAQTHLCPDTFVPRHDCAHMIKPIHDCAPKHVCAQIRLCPDIFDWCPDMIVPRHESWPDKIMYNNIIDYCVHKIMRQLDWWKDKHAQLLLAKRCEMWLFNYCSAITSSIPTGIFHYFIICQDTKYVSGHKRTRFCRDMIVTTRLYHARAQMCLGTSMHGHKRVWAQTWVGTNVLCGHKRVWAQTCVGTNVSGHKRAWAQACLGTIVWAQVCTGTNVWSP